MSTTLSDIIDIVQRQTNLVDAQFRERVRDAVEEAVDEFAERAAIPSLLKYETFITDGSKFLAMPERVRQIKSVTDLTNTQAVTPGDHWDSDHTVLWTQTGNTGTPWEFRDIGHAAVISQPSTDSYLNVTASVSEVQSFYITGLARDTAASGTALEFYEVNETLAILDDTTYTSTNQYYEVLRLERSDDNQNSSIKVADVSKTISRIGPRERSATFRRIEFLSTPPVGLNMRVEYYVKPDFLVDETAAILPGFDLEFIKWRAIGNVHWFKSELEGAERAWARADKALNNHRISEVAQGKKSRTLRPDWRYGDMERFRRRFRGSN